MKKSRGKPGEKKAKADLELLKERLTACNKEMNDNDKFCKTGMRSKTAPVGKGEDKDDPVKKDVKNVA